MKITILLLVFAQTMAFGQIDTTFIEEIPRDKTVQLHTTFQNFSVNLRDGADDVLLFRLKNWSIGPYFKWGIAELFVAHPIKDFGSQAYDNPNSFGTGFGINLYPGKFHFNYNFRYVQGFESHEQVRNDGFETLNKFNYYLFNRMNIHYIPNSEKFSMKSAIRFNDKQIKSAGSIILGAPISFQLARVSDAFNSELENYSRLSGGLMAGYGYTHVMGDLALFVLAKGGFDLRYSSFRSMESLAVLPAINVKTSAVYHWNKNFVGLVYDYYPEFDNSDELNITIENWKLRIFLGKRFY